MKIEFTGWKAVAALVVIGGVIGGSFLLERSTLEADAIEDIKLFLQGEYVSASLHGYDTSQMTDEEMEAKAEELLKLDDIQITSVRARGRGEDVVVRLEIQVAGEDPPDGKPVRYYKLSYSTIAGWRVRHETTALSFYLKFPL